MCAEALQRGEETETPGHGEQQAILTEVSNVSSFTRGEDLLTLKKGRKWRGDVFAIMHSHILKCVYLLPLGKNVPL